MSSKGKGGAMTSPGNDMAPAYVPHTLATQPHENAITIAAKVRARDEQQAYNALQQAQYNAQIYNQEIEPEHDVDWYCTCSTCNYKRLKQSRLGVHKLWSEAVMYPGEKRYHDVYQRSFSQSYTNPYNLRVISPYGWSGSSSLFRQAPSAGYHAKSVRQTIALNNELNAKAQANIDAMEPRYDIWATPQNAGPAAMPNGFSDANGDVKNGGASVGPSASQSQTADAGKKAKRFSGFANLFKGPSPEAKVLKAVGSVDDLRAAILKEETGRWPDAEWRNIVGAYQEKVGMRNKILELRHRQPLQYLHLLRAGYFEPIPVAWADLLSNPLKFSIEAAAGWRGITPSWRGYEDTAEERLYWVLNHRTDPDGAANTSSRLKPDFISALEMATQRMNSATEPPPQYFSQSDTCNVQHVSSKGYSKQVMPPPFRAYDRPETPSDDTMILLDVSGSMDFEPMRPVYDQYLIKQYAKTLQPKNKDVAKAIVRRFTDAMANHDHLNEGYDMVTFSTHAKYVGKITHRTLDQQWSGIKMGGGTRVMTGWQKVKNLHFEKHHESATYHPIYGWQAGPETPMLRLLLLLDGEATDMDEFELDLLGLSWAHVTIFLIGAEGCVHHHRHANELARIGNVNHHVSFVDAQGNTPERFVTHELLKRHLGQDLTMEQFTELEVPPAYDIAAGM